MFCTKVFYIGSPTVIQIPLIILKKYVKMPTNYLNNIFFIFFNLFYFFLTKTDITEKTDMADHDAKNCRVMLFLRLQTMTNTLEELIFL